MSLLNSRYDFAGLGRIVLGSIAVAFIVGFAAGYFTKSADWSSGQATRVLSAGSGAVLVKGLANTQVSALHAYAQVDLGQITTASTSKDAAGQHRSVDDKPNAPDRVVEPIADRSGHDAAGEKGTFVLGAATGLTGERTASTIDAALTRNPVETTSSKILVKRGDTLLDILGNAGLGRLEAHEVIEALTPVYDPRRLRVGQQLAVQVAENSGARTLIGLAFSIDSENDLMLSRDPDGVISVEKLAKSFESQRQRAEGAINASLYLAAQNANVPQDALMALIRLYSWDIDFQRDIHPGDRFSLLYDRLVSDDGSVTRSGDIFFAELTTGGEPLRAYRFENKDGGIGYYDETGHSLRKWLMRTPVDGARLSSRFGKRRHPILGYNKMHKGVDFAAPRGTPIYAAGDGRVAALGRNGGYGKYIRIRHNGTYSTAYAHMHNYAKGLKKGNRVKQGQVIGYVGSTGRSTGPHLHYELLKNGSQINPLSVKQDVAERLKGAELARFEKIRDQIDQEYADWSDTTRMAQRR